MIKFFMCLVALGVADMASASVPDVAISESVYINASYSVKSENASITNEDLINAGVPQENLDKAREYMKQANRKYKLLILEKRELGLKANNLVLAGAEANLAELDALFDKIGVIEATLYKNSIRNTIEMSKLIDPVKYQNARKAVLERLQGKRVELPQ